MSEANAWIDMITKLYTHLHESDAVMHTSNENTKKRERIYKYFERLERVHNKVSNSKSKSSELLLKKFYYDMYVVKPENIPDSYFQNEQRIMRERGYGNVELTSERKQILIDQIISDQKESLDKWIEYFLYDEESKSYEMWEKYWVFQGLQKLGKFDKEKMKFSKRDKTTVYPFPPVEREAIFSTLKLMEDYIKGKDTEEEIKNALGSGNFKTLYEYSMKQMMLKGEKQNNTTKGKWVKYEQGSDYNSLRNSLQGYYTGWCTAAGENFAKGQLANGDFYVYYTMDENNEPKVPRIAIRMDGKDTIGEIRGIADNQNMEPEMMPILNEKLEEFPDKDRYQKKEYDMQYLTSIDRKVQKGIELSVDELRFLYEIDSKIEGFGYEEDPRIKEIKSKRDNFADLTKIFNGVEKINGNLDLHWLTRAKGLVLPKEIGGHLKLGGLRSAEGLILPEKIGGHLDLSGLTSAEGLVLPEKIGGTLRLNSLTSAEGLVLPEKVGSLSLDRLRSAEGLVLPEKVGSLSLDRLRSAEGLILPEKIGGYLGLSRLTSAEGLVLPKEIGDSLYLSRLRSAEGLILPEKIGGKLDLRCLTGAEGLVFPEKIGDTLDLFYLTSAKDLVLPKEIGGCLDLFRLTSAEGLILPEKIGDTLNLNCLTSAEGLVMPKEIGGALYLNSLTSAKDLVLPKEIGGRLVLSELTSAEGLILPEKIGGELDLSGLTSAEGLIMPKEVGDMLHLDGLTSAEGLILPKKIGDILWLDGLTSAEGLILPEEIGDSLYLRGLTSAEGLVIPEGIDLNKIHTKYSLIKEIMANPLKYYRHPETNQNDTFNNSETEVHKKR